ncbi:MAG: hypothetical protein AAGC56_00625 [Pseudomonadota bacterium]
MKTPMLRPVVEALVFGFEQIPTVIRIGWFPLLLAIIIPTVAFSTLCGPTCSPQIVVEGEGDPEIIAEAVGEALEAINPVLLVSCAVIVGLIAELLVAPIMVVVTRAATRADYTPPRGPIYFALGPREIRYVLVQLIYGVIIAVLVTVFGGLAALAIGGGVAAMEETGGAAGGFALGAGALAALALGLVGLWLALRFLPVLAIAAVDNRIDFGGAWAMTKGNFWRLAISGLFFINLLSVATMVFFLVIILPVALVLLLASAALSALLGAGAFVLMALLALIALPAGIAVICFSVAAEAAYPGRIYAYLSGCGDECKYL